MIILPSFMIGFFITDVAPIRGEIAGAQQRVARLPGLTHTNKMAKMPRIKQLGETVARRNTFY